jgi:hypothetical protein
VTFGRGALVAVGLIAIPLWGVAADDGVPPPEPTPGPTLPVAPASNPFNEDRILKVIPDYQTVRDSRVQVPPLTAKEKWVLAWKETVDPFNIATGFMTAAMSQAGNETPKYGEGGWAYAKRVGAALGDNGTQNFFSAGVLANILHQDPRYFRDGPQHGIVHRILYSVSRVVVARQDSGTEAFNASGVGGAVLGIATSNLYYPSASRHGSVMAGRLWTSLFGNVTGNLMSEFWPDLEKRFFHKKEQ